MSVSAESAFCDASFARAPRMEVRTTCFLVRFGRARRSLAFFFFAGARLAGRLFAGFFERFFFFAMDVAIGNIKWKKGNARALAPECGKARGKLRAHRLRTRHRCRIPCGFGSS